MDGGYRTFLFTIPVRNSVNDSSFIMVHLTFSFRFRLSSRSSLFLDADELLIFSGTLRELSP